MSNLQVGAIIKTSYNTGPYIIIDVHECEDGSISLTLNAAPPNNKEAGDKRYWINGIRQVDGRWMAYVNDEIFIVQEAPKRLVQLKLF